MFENLQSQPLNTAKPHGLSRILFVGNSFMFYNCGVVGFINGFAKAKGIDLTLTLVGIGGASLYWHDVKSYLRPHGLRSYVISSDGANTVEFINYEGGKIFDAVVLEDSSQGPIHPALSKLFRQSLTQHVKDIRQVGSVPFLMMTWGYRDKPEMIEKLACATIDAANTENIPVIPVGLAFDRIAKTHPAIELIRSDNRHPTVAGTYLQAAVFFSALTGQSPEGADFNGRFDDLVVTEEQARILQKVAWETVCDFNHWRSE